MCYFPHTSHWYRTKYKQEALFAQAYSDYSLLQNMSVSLLVMHSHTYAYSST